MTLKIDPHKPFPPSMFKKGMRVRFRRKYEMKFCPTHGWNSVGEMDYLYGKTGIIADIPSSDGKFIRITGIDKLALEWWSISTDMLVPLVNKREMKRLEAQQKQLEAQQKREETEKAEKAAEEAKVRRDKRAMLPSSARNVVKLLDANPEAFGCQRRYVIALCSAMFGLDLSGIVK